jgi:serine/threonine protein kinase
VKFYAVQILDAVRHLHKKNTIHRDLKLENILVDERGYLQIIDFGVSKRLYENNLYCKTICGTLPNMAPEQHSGEKYTKSVDLWAIGIMLYEMLYGRNPFNLSQQDLSAEDFRDIIQSTDVIFPDQLSQNYDIRYSQEIKNLIL